MEVPFKYGKEKQPKVYIDKNKLKYGSSRVPDTKNKPINKESKVVYHGSKALDDFTNEPSKVDKPIDYTNANESLLHSLPVMAP